MESQRNNSEVTGNGLEQKAMGSMAQGMPPTGGQDEVADLMAQAVSPTNSQEKHRRVAKYLLLGILVVIAVAVAAVIINREWVADFLRGMDYRPSAEMARIRDDLELTDRGLFIFNATRPALEKSGSFNQDCREEETTTAILGCYTKNNIYVYDITEPELDGIRELTTAHELLHAVYERLAEGDREGLRASLEEVYQKNKKVLEEDLAIYDEGERFEELYVRAGTEIKSLPEVLEKHYAEIFQNQDGIVDFYDNYIGVFNAVEDKIKALGEEMEILNAEINQKLDEYEKRSNQLVEEITEFNDCAGRMGCFKSEDEFLARRQVLISEQESLDTLYDEIGALIDSYNVKVDEYNKNVLHHQELNYKINSSSEIKNKIEEEDGRQ